VESALYPTLYSLNLARPPLWYVSFHIVSDVSRGCWYSTKRRGRLQGEYDAIIVPGGAKGAETMSQSPFVQSLVKSFYEQGKYVGMICAGMTLMRSWRWAALIRAFETGSLAAKTSHLPRQPLTSHPSVKKELDKGICHTLREYPLHDLR
jgi:putative intracellular protease/amidase